MQRHPAAPCLPAASVTLRMQSHLRIHLAATRKLSQQKCTQGVATGWALLRRKAAGRILYRHVVWPCGISLCLPPDIGAARMAPEIIVTDAMPVLKHSLSPKQNTCLHSRKAYMKSRKLICFSFSKSCRESIGVGCLGRRGSKQLG